MSQTKAQLIDNLVQPITGALGSASAPTFSFTTDPNTGIYSPGADQLAISTGGSGRLFVDSSGEVTSTNQRFNLITVGRGAGSISTNTAIGASALAANTSGSQNTALGNLALLTNTTGQYNTAIGVAALNTNNGNNNTAVGRVALYFNSSGSNNVAVGHASLYNNTTGANNVCVGVNAGFDLTTGSDNTIIGNITGTAGLANTVIIGAGSTERLRIDSSGRLGVGTSSPGGKLEILQDSTANTTPAIRITGSAGDPTNYYMEAVPSLSGSLVNYRFNVKNITTYSDVLCLSGSGRVGIGTSSPSSLLHVSGGDILLSNAYSLLARNNANTLSLALIRRDASDNVVIDPDQYGTKIGGTTLVTTSAGRVGIGTSSPLALLDVRGNVYMTGNGTSRQTTTVVNTGGSFENGVESSAGASVFTGSTAYASVIGSQNSTPLQFGTNGAIRATLDTSGRLGIGTTTVNSLLEVRGTSDGQNILHLSNNAGTSDGGATNVIRSTCNGNTNWSNLRYDAYGHFWNVNGSEAMRIDGAKRLLVGTSTTNGGSDAFIQVRGNSSGSNFEGKINLSTGTATNSIVNDTTLGSIQFGNNSTIASAALIECKGDAQWGTNDYPTKLVFSTTADGASSPTERMRISNSGMVTITGPQMNLSSNSGHAYLYVEAQNAASQNAYLYLSCPGSNAGGMYYERSTSRLYAWSQNIGTTGVYMASGGTSWTSVSDERQKEILEPIENATDKVSTLRAVIGKYKTDEEGTRRSFLIAQDVQAVLPEAVSTEDPNSLGLAYTDVIPLLVAAIKEQQTMITELQAKVAALESA